MRNRLLFLFIALFLLLQLPMLALKFPQEREGWLADIAYHWDPQMTGKMAIDIPWGSTWSSGRGKLFYFAHHLFYKIFGIGLFQGRMITFLSALLLLFLLFKWTAKNISRESALLSTIFLMISFSFWPFLPVVSQDIPHCLFFFASFYLLWLAMTSKKGSLFFATGLISALSVDLSYRGIEVVACVYLMHLFFTDRKIFLRDSGYLLAGSLVAFVYWTFANIWPMGVENFLQYHILPSRTESEPHFFKVLTNEIGRLWIYLKSQRHLAKIEIAYWVVLIFVFFKYRLNKKFSLPCKYLLYWMVATFLVTSLVSQIDMQTSPVYMLLYAIFISILCGISLEELQLRYGRCGRALLVCILTVAMGYQISRVGMHLYFHGNAMFARHHQRLQSHVDLTKHMIGDVEFWYAFTDAQYYGGIFYLIRVINVLHELKYPHEYDNPHEKAETLLQVLKKRDIKYIVTHPGPGCLKEFMSRYFPNQKWPERNFKFIGRVDDYFKWNRYFRPGPEFHYNIEFYEVISYDVTPTLSHG